MITLIKLLVEVSIDQLRKDWVESGKMEPEVFDRICRSCENKSNWVTWMVKRVSQGFIADEDIELWNSYIHTFERYKVRFQTKDINQIKTAEQIANFRQECVDVQQAADERIANTGGEKMKGSKEERKREVDQFRFPDYKNSVTGEVFEVFKLPKEEGRKNQKYAIELGTKTSWCTASRGTKNYYATYICKGPLYIFINKLNSGDKYQIHVETNQFKNPKDQEVDYNQDKFLDFYNYLQKVDKITLPISVRRVLTKKQILRDADKYPSDPKKFELPFKIKPGEKWYCFKAPLVDKITTILNILQLDTPPEWIFSDKIVLISNLKNHIISDGNRVYGASDNFNRNQYFEGMSSDQFRVFLRMLDSVHLTFHNDEVSMMLDDTLPSLEEFEVGNLNGAPVYYFDAPESRLSKVRYEARRRFARSAESKHILCKLHTGSDEMSIIGPNIEYVYGVIDRVSDIARVLANFKDLEEMVPSVSFSRLRENLQKVSILFQAVRSTEPTVLPDTVKIKLPENFLSLGQNCYGWLGRSSKIRTIAYIIEHYGLMQQLYKISKKSSNWYIAVIGDDVHFFRDGYYQSTETKSQLPESPKIIVSRLEKLHLDIPEFLEKIVGRDRAIASGEIGINIPTLLRTKASELKRCEIASLGLTRVYEVNGLEGTYQDFKPNLMRSCSGYAQDIENYLSINNCNNTRVILYGEGSDWNAFISVGIDHKIMKVWTRTGYGEGLIWRSKEFTEESLGKVQRRWPEGTALLEGYDPRFTVIRFQKLAGIL